jgi:hypothetical protein
MAQANTTHWPALFFLVTACVFVAFWETIDPPVCERALVMWMRVDREFGIRSFS